ncbi:transmembrane protein [Pelagophyceae sp. CCMP2097]|nr:transmembrane protein [Pelagophyceae sp. CCMP2097]
MAVSGYLCVVGAVVGFGSNFVPVKIYDTGDGLFFQLVMCLAIWSCGMVLDVARGSPEFCPFAMIGGALWCTGNVMARTRVQFIT